MITRGIRSFILLGMIIGFSLLFVFDLEAGAYQLIDSAGFQNFSVEAIEVTQSVQDLAQSVPLISNKRTLVRVYLNYHSNTPVNVEGILDVFDFSIGQWTSLNSLNAVTADAAANGRLKAKRIDLEQSLNFELPLNLLAEGVYSYSINSIINASSAQVLRCANCPNISMVDEMEPSLPLQIRVIGLRYSRPGRRGRIIHEPRQIDFDLLQSWIRRAYPVGELTFSSVTVDAAYTWPFTCDDANAQIAAIRKLDIEARANPRTHYYGLVFDSGSANGFMRGGAAYTPGQADPSVVASGPTGVPHSNFSWDQDNSYGDWYAGHELGHTFGRSHPGFCDQLDDDSDPSADGSITLFDSSYVAIDLGDSLMNIPMKVSDATWHDVMTYCENQWLSRYTYMAIIDRIREENSLPMDPSPEKLAVSTTNSLAGMALSRAFDTLSIDSIHEEPKIKHEFDSLLQTSEGDFIGVTGSINLTKSTGKFTATDRLTRAIPSPESADQKVIVRLTGGDDGTLLSFNAEIKLNTDPAPLADSTGIIDCILPYVPRTNRIELWVNGKIADSRDVTKGVPDEAKNTAKKVKDLEGNYDLQWKAKDADTRKLRYHVLISQDEGKSWNTIVYNSPSTEFEVSKDEYGKTGKQLLFRIIATDGFNNSIIRQDTVSFQ